MKLKNQIIGLLEHIFISVVAVFAVTFIIALPILLTIYITKWGLVLYLVYIGIYGGIVSYYDDKRRLW